MRTVHLPTPGEKDRHARKSVKARSHSSSEAFATQRQTSMGPQSGNELLASYWWALVCQKLDKQLQADGSKDVNAY